MKKKNKINKAEHDKKYNQVCAALAYFSEIRHENQKREEARRKSQSVLLKISLVGCVALLALDIVTRLDFDLSWMSSFGEWYNEIYVSLMIYTILTVIVMFFEKKLKFDQKPAFGYIWPFVGFFITTFLGKTITASMVPASFNYIIASIATGALLGYLWLSSFIQLGKEKGERELNIAKRASEILEENPEIVKEVLDDFERDMERQETNNEK